MNFRRTAVAALIASCVFVLFHGTARASIDARAHDLIAQSGRAMGVGALSRVHVVHLKLSVDAVGFHGNGEQWLGLSSSRFAESVTLGPIVQADGFDGRACWNQDGTGLTWNDGSDAGRATAIDNAYASTYDLWKPGASGAAVTYAGTKSLKGHAYDVLTVRPVGSKLPFDIWFDRVSHLPIRTVLVRGPVSAVQTFSDYRRVDGLMVPFHSVSATSDGNTSDTRVTQAVADPPGAASHLERPTTVPHDFSMSAGTSTTIPIDIVENHVYLNVMLNGKGPYRFIFDTGGQNLIDPEVAKEIGAAGQGSLQGTGVGSQSDAFSFAMVRTLGVGNAMLKDQLFAVAPVRKGFGVTAGQPADGLIGWEVLARYVTNFNYAGKTVTLTMPDAAKPPANAHVIPFVLNGTQPQIPCAIDGVASECTIDTGARDTLSLFGPYVTAHPRVRPATLTANGVTGYGFGGAAFGRLGRVQTVTLDDLTLRDLIGDFTSQTAGAFAQPFVAANLGGSLLRRFDVTFDYGQQTMALVPNATFASRDQYDRSGLFLLRQGGSTLVLDVRPGTPAADAGIAKGDAVVSIDGKPTSGMSLEAVRAYFLEPAGTVLHLVVAGKGKPDRAVTLTLRDYV